MKNTALILLILAFTASALRAQMPPPPGNPATAQAGGTDMQQIVPAGMINFEGVDVNQVLEVYAQLVGRTLLRASLPQASIVLKTETNLTKAEAIQPKTPWRTVSRAFGLNEAVVLDAFRHRAVPPGVEDSAIARFIERPAV